MQHDHTLKRITFSSVLLLWVFYSKSCIPQYTRFWIKYSRYVIIFSIISSSLILNNRYKRDMVQFYNNLWKLFIFFCHCMAMHALQLRPAWCKFIAENSRHVYTQMLGLSCELWTKWDACFVPCNIIWLHLGISGFAMFDRDANKSRWC